MIEQRHRTGAWLATLIVALMSWGGLHAAPALAAARVVFTSPTSGSNVTATPPEIRVGLSEAVRSATITLTGPAGKKANTAPVMVSGNEASIDINGGLAVGKWQSRYTLETASGKVNGTINFTISDSGPEGDTVSPGGAIPPTPGQSASESSASSTSESSPSASESPSATPSDPSAAVSEVAASTSSTPLWFWPLLGLLLLGGIVLGFLAVRGRRADDWDEPGSGGPSAGGPTGPGEGGYDDELVRRSAYGQYPEQGQVPPPANYLDEANASAPISPTERIPTDQGSTDWSSEWLNDPSRRNPEGR